VAIAAIWTVLGMRAQQRVATTNLSVRVEPEQHLMPGRVDLSFRVSGDGRSDVLTQSQPVAAWVRALPGQHIRVIAAASGVPDQAELRWTASATRAASGAESARCTNGVFQGSTNDLVSNWSRSGILTCAVTFELANARALAPGIYPISVSLTLRAE
jgi:hypothetical protein